MPERAGRVLEIHRYPVKAMAGESLEVGLIDERGLEGDRAWAVYTEDERLATGKSSRRFRRRDGIFTLAARTVDVQDEDDGEDDERVEVLLPGGAVVVAGTEEADARLSAHFEEPVRMSLEGTTEAIGSHFDAAAMSVVGSATLARLGELLGLDAPVDARHLRANVVLETTEPFIEDTWVGRRLLTGGADLAVSERAERCRMVDVAQADLPACPDLLKTIAKVNDVCAAVYLKVNREGVVHVDDDACVV